MCLKDRLANSLEQLLRMSLRTRTEYYIHSVSWLVYVLSAVIVFSPRATPTPVHDIFVRVIPLK